MTLVRKQVLALFVVCLAVFALFVGTVPAHAANGIKAHGVRPYNNSHTFCSSSNSRYNALTTTNQSSAPIMTLRPGGCNYGDWIYVPSGHTAVNTDRTLGPGWHYDNGGYGSFTRYRIT